METTQVPELVRAEARLPRWMVATAAVSTAASFLIGKPHFAAGVALGAALGILNYFWLHQAVENLMAGRNGRLPWRIVVKFAVRYPLAFAGIYLFYKTGWLPLAAILAGLFVPVAGVLAEAVVQICKGFRVTDIE